MSDRVTEFQLLVSVANANGLIDAAEVETLKGYCKTWFEGEDVTRALESLEVPPAPEDVLDQLKKSQRGQKYGFVLLTNAIDVAAASNGVDADERKLLVELGKLYRLEEDLIDYLIALRIGREQDGVA